MKEFHVKLKADNLAIAEIALVGEHSVNVRIDSEDRWDAEGLLRLSDILKGVAATLVAAPARRG